MAARRAGRGAEPGGGHGARRRVLPALLMCLLVLAVGCARLPPRPALPVETAIMGVGDTPLDQRIQPMTAAHPG